MSELCDHAYLQRLATELSGGRDQVGALIEGFIARLPSLLAALLDAPDDRSRRRTAHALASAATSVGACALADTARDIEAHPQRLAPAQLRRCAVASIGALDPWRVPLG